MDAAEEAAGTERSAAPRARDLPPPRENPSVAAPLFRTVFAWPYRLVLAGLLRAGFRAWHLTLLSFVANVVVGVLLLTGRRLLPGLLLLPAGLLDIFDGAVARHRGEESRKGALLDSLTDRACEGIVFGCLFFSLAEQNQTIDAALALASMIVSLLVSHLRAESEAAGLKMAKGIFQRLERYLALIVGLIVPGALRPALALLTGLGALTALQRIGGAWQRIGMTAARPPSDRA
ncbi:MAG TPA: CDP-alcohol phosphatidyltransferase family protein [Actinomycetota bacterium]|nr:CDP-alcohol phosphatidyltransferase family protein [Actinomycetota bacterium]